MKRRDIQIPVLGNSICDFPDSKEYPFIKGYLAGFESWNGAEILEQFLESIKEQS